MDGVDYTSICDESLEENIRNNNLISINSCNNYSNHTDLYLEGDFSIILIVFYGITTVLFCTVILKKIN